MSYRPKVANFKHVAGRAGVVVSWLLAAFLTGVTPHTDAQNQGPDSAATPTPELPGRDSEGIPPEREPTVLDRRVSATDVTVTVVLPAEADTYIASARPNENLGASAMYLGYNFGGAGQYGAERMLLHFGASSSIPANAIIHSAFIRVYMFATIPAGDPAMGTILRQLNSAWDEYTVTWNTEPAWGAVRASASIGSNPGWYEYDVTELAKAWIDLTVAEHGVEIIGDEQIQQRERVFYSRATTTGNYPRLVVNYTIFNDTEPPNVSVTPLPAFSSRTFPVSWSGTDPGSSGLAYYDVQYRVDGGGWIDWLSQIDYVVAEFTGEDSHLYELRARGVDQAGNVEPFGAAEAGTRVDTRPPTSQVGALPGVSQTDSFMVSWGGQDSSSGIQYYDVQYRIDDGAWVPWQQHTVNSAATFIPMGDGVYAFEARAVDNFGLIEPFTGQPEAATAVDREAPFIEAQVWLPLVQR